MTTWYRAGTVNVTLNSVNVVGVGTAFLENVKIGDEFNGPDGRSYEITNVATNTSITLATPYKGSTASAQAYQIKPTQGWARGAALKLADLLSKIGAAIQRATGALQIEQYFGEYDTPAKKALARTGLGLGTASIAELTDLLSRAELNTSMYEPKNRGIMRVGDLGFGGKSASRVPDGTSLNEYSGKETQIRYYSLSALDKPPGSSYGSLMVFNTTNGFSSLLSIPYRDQDGLHYKAGFNGLENRDWTTVRDTRNTTVDSNGFIKSASPIIKLFNDSIAKTGHLELANIDLIRIGVGYYELRNAPLLSRDGWYIETPKDRNGNVYFTLDYEEHDGVLTIRTYTPDYSEGPAKNGDPVDILDGRFVSLRFAEDPSLYPEPEPEPEPDDQNEFEEPAA